MHIPANIHGEGQSTVNGSPSLASTLVDLLY